jgi:hypothetical protein
VRSTGKIVSLSKAIPLLMYGLSLSDERPGMDAA